MLKYNLKRMLSDRSILKPVGHLARFGINKSTASRILSGRLSTVKLSLIEKLCIALHCTPNDLLEYTPDEKIKTTDHPLTKLIRNQQSIKVTELLKDIPVDELPAFTNKIAELKQELFKKN